jgi:mannose-1-phosphate guanylyltransferase
LTRASIGPFLVNTHYLAEVVEAHVKASRYRDRGNLVHERELRGTAGALIANLEFFQDEDGLLVHADNYCTADFRAFVRAHHERPPECLMTIVTFRTDDPPACGIVEIDARGVVVGFHEKVAAPPENLANGSLDIAKQLIDALADAGFDAVKFQKRTVEKVYTKELLDSPHDSLWRHVTTAVGLDRSR